MAYIYSTLSADMVYKNKDETGEVTATVFVAGKANIPNKHMLTVRGVSTEVTDNQLDALNKNRVFQLHKQNGFIAVDHKRHDAEKVAADMNGMDKSAPDTAEKLESEGKEVPEAGKKGKRGK